MKMQIIDIDKWDRKTIYNNFIAYTNPSFSIAARLDVTELLAECKRTGVSFFLAFMYVASKCLNSVEEFRLRLKDGNVVLYDEINPSFIIRLENGVIATCRTQMTDDLYSFCRAAREAQKKVIAEGQEQFNNDDNAVFYTTCLPWTDVISFTNPYDFDDPEASSIPRLMWSKFVEENERYKMTFDIAAHHALIDGEPVCRAINAVQAALNDAKKFF